MLSALGSGIIITMNPVLVSSAPSSIQTELLAVTAADFQTTKGPDAKPQPTLLSTDPALLAATAAVLASGEFKASPNETLLLHAPAGIAAKRLLIIGLGKQGLGKADKLAPIAVRNAAGTAVRFAKPRTIRELVFALPESQKISPPQPPHRLPSKALSSATSTPTPTAAIAKTRASQSFTLAAPDSADKAASKPPSRGRHRRREPELRPLPGQRARQQAHAHHPRPARRRHGRRSRPRLRSPLHREAPRAEDGRILERLARLRRAARADRPAL